MSDREMTIRITSGTMLTGVLIVLLVAALFYLRDLVLIVLTSVVIASAIEPGVLWLMKRRLPRVVSVIILYAIVLSVLFGIVYAFIPPLLEEAAGFLASAPGILESIEIPIGESIFQAQQAVSTFTLQQALFDFREIFTDSSSGFFKTVSAVFGGLFSFLFLIVFSFYLSVQEGGIDDFLRIVTPVKQEKYVLGLWRRAQKKIGLWMQGQLILSLIVIVLVYLGLSLLQVPYALLLAISAGVFELIPVFGSILAAAPAVFVGFIDGGTSVALLVGALYLIVNQFQANLIYPLVVKKVVGVPPLLVILALIIGAQLAGFLGILLSVPIAATLQEFAADVEAKKKAIMAKENGE